MRFVVIALLILLFMPQAAMSDAYAPTVYIQKTLNGLIANDTYYNASLLSEKVHIGANLTKVNNSDGSITLNSVSGSAGCTDDCPNLTVATKETTWDTVTSKEPAISAGAANQFYSWDKSWRSVDYFYVLNIPCFNCSIPYSNLTGVPSDFSNATATHLQGVVDSYNQSGYPNNSLQNQINGLQANDSYFNGSGFPNSTNFRNDSLQVAIDTKQPTGDYATNTALTNANNSMNSLKLNKTDQAADSLKLNGQLAAFYQVAGAYLTSELDPLSVHLTDFVSWVHSNETDQSGKDYTNSTNASMKIYVDKNNSDQETEITGKEPAISQGTYPQLWAFNKTFQNITTDWITEGSNLFFTNTRVISVVQGYFDSFNTTELALQKNDTYFNGTEFPISTEFKNSTAVTAFLNISTNFANWTLWTTDKLNYFTKSEYWINLTSQNFVSNLTVDKNLSNYTNTPGFVTNTSVDRNAANLTGVLKNASIPLSAANTSTQNTFTRLTIFNSNISINSTNNKEAIDMVGNIVFRGTDTSNGFTIGDRLTQQGKQLFFIGNEGSYTVFNIGTLNANTSNRKLSQISLWSVNPNDAVSTNNDTQFGMRRFGDVSTGVIFTQVYQNGLLNYTIPTNICIESAWDGNTPSSFCINSTTKNINMGLNLTPNTNITNNIGAPNLNYNRIYAKTFAGGEFADKAPGGYNYNQLGNSSNIYYSAVSQNITTGTWELARGFGYTNMVKIIPGDTVLIDDNRLITHGGYYAKVYGNITRQDKLIVSDRPGVLTNARNLTVPSYQYVSGSWQIINLPVTTNPLLYNTYDSAQGVAATVVGYALEPYNSNDTGIIEIFVH